jgi:hypothetical protein
MENEAFTDMMEDFALLKIECKSGFFFAVLFVFCFEDGKGVSGFRFGVVLEDGAWKN